MLDRDQKGASEVYYKLVKSGRAVNSRIASLESQREISTTWSGSPSDLATWAPKHPEASRAASATDFKTPATSSRRPAAGSCRSTLTTLA